MKRWLLSALTLLLLVSISLPVLAAENGKRKRPGGDKGRAGGREGSVQQAMMMQILRKFDRNGNGQLDAEEQKALVTAADKNLDGRVSPDEVMALIRGGEGQGRKGKEADKGIAGKKKKVE